MTGPSTDADNVNQLDQAWREHRRHLLDVAFRTLGRVSEAEDVVQEAFVRLARIDVDQIENIGGWLVVAVGRLCIDRLRSQRRHPTSPDAALGDRSADRLVDPADQITLDDSVRTALHLVLERLTPAERTVFVLHDVFQYSFVDIGEIVGRTPTACRQLASRARRAISSDVGAARFQVESSEQRRVTEQFVAACSSGDLDGLLAVLDPHVSGHADVGGHIGTRTESGRTIVAPLILQFLGPKSGTTLLSLPGGPGPRLVALRNRRVEALVSLTVRDGRIKHIDALVNSIKLAPAVAALGI